MSRIIRVADSYDAMITRRPYKEPMSPREAIKELDCCAGTMFAPLITTQLITLIKQELFDEGKRELLAT